MTLILLLVFFTPLFIGIAGMFYYAKKNQRISRLPVPIEDVIRAPGYQLHLQIIDGVFDLCTYLMQTVMACMMPFAIAGLFEILGKHIPAEQTIFFYLILLVFTAYLIWKIIKTTKYLHNLKLGYTAEIITSHYIAKINRLDVHVFHDLQCGQFNIDHVVTSPHGIIAVETKGRRKPISKSAGKSSVKYEVIVNENNLEFPYYTDTQSQEQANRQACWLEAQLKKSAGLSNLKVEPVVVLPGWYIKRNTNKGVRVLNAKEIPQFLFSKSSPILTTEQLSQVNHQLEQLAKIGEIK